MKSQVALKEGRSLWLCPLMGGAAAAHTAILLLLYKQQLWRNLIMTPLGSNMGGVRTLLRIMTVCFAAAMLRHVAGAHNMEVATCVHQSLSWVDRKEGIGLTPCVTCMWMLSPSRVFLHRNCRCGR